MEQVLTVLAVNLGVVAAAFFVIWLLIQLTRDCTPVDAYWGIGMGIIATSTFLQVPQTERSWALLILGWMWALRLGAYMLWRWVDHGSDRRYVRMLEKAKEKRGQGLAMASFMLVIVPQAPLQFLVSLPLQLGQIPGEAATLGLIGKIGVAVALMGLAWETIADMQLTRFRKNPANQGQVMSSGLWRYSRHPNYFGEASFWWGLFLIAAETSVGLITIVSPAVLTWILINWSGAPTMEHRMRKEKPGYREYVESTSLFIPMPPSKKRPSGS